MRARLTVSAVAVPLVFIVLFFLPQLVLTIVICLISALAAFEFVRAVMPGRLASRLTIYAMVFAALVPLATHFGGGVLHLTILIVTLLLFFCDSFLTYTEEDHLSFVEIVAFLFGAFLIPYLISAIINLKGMENGRYCALFPIIAAFLSDSGAYFVGVLFGRHKLAPQISPKKSYEGCLGGFVFAIGFMLIYGLVLRALDFSVSLPVFAVYGFLGSLVTQIGDLTFSLIKRECEIKDFGTLLPGHGGVLDRLDGLMFAIPLMYILLTYFPAFV